MPDSEEMDQTRHVAGDFGPFSSGAHYCYSRLSVGDELVRYQLKTCIETIQDARFEVMVSFGIVQPAKISL